MHRILHKTRHEKSRHDYHRLERERIHLLLIDEAGKGLDDIVAGRVRVARAAIQSIKLGRAASQSPEMLP